jgi:hypothetical protein
LLRFLLNLAPVVLRVGTATITVADFMRLRAHAPASLRGWSVRNGDRCWPGNRRLGNIIGSAGARDKSQDREYQYQPAALVHGRFQDRRLAFLRLANLAMRRSTSFFGADRIRFIMLSNRSKGVSPPGSSPGGITKVDCFGLLIGFPVFLVPDDSVFLRHNRRFRLAGQLLVGQASTSRTRKDFPEAASVSVAVLGSL